MEYILKKSNRKGKRFMIKIDNKNYHFGALPFEKGTFIDHKNQKIKNAWIARHKDVKIIIIKNQAFIIQDIYYGAIIHH